MPINYNKYPQNWKEIRKRILNRAGHKCENCGLENHSIVISVKEKDKPIKWINNYDWIESFLVVTKEVKVILTIAHLDHDKENHDVTDDRLKAMCQLCHLRYDSKEKIKRRSNK